MALAGWTGGLLGALRERRQVAVITDFVEHDAAPVFVTGADGRIYVNLGRETVVFATMIASTL